MLRGRLGLDPGICYQTNITEKLTSLRLKINILGLTKVSEADLWILLFLVEKIAQGNQHLPHDNIRCAKLTFGT